MSLTATQTTMGEHPAMAPIPLGVPVPAAVKAASDAYAEARDALAEAQEAHRVAQRRDAQGDRHYRQALDQAAAAGARRSDVQKPFSRSAATGAAYDAALRAALDAELVLADAIFDHRPQWLQDVEQVRSDASGRVGQLLRELAVALRDTHALARLQTILTAWRYDPDTEPHHRLSVLHKSAKPQHRPDFASVVEAMATNEIRMQRVRSAAERDY